MKKLKRIIASMLSTCMVLSLNYFPIQATSFQDTYVEGNMVIDKSVTEIELDSNDSSAQKDGIITLNHQNYPLTSYGQFTLIADIANGYSGNVTWTVNDSRIVTIEEDGERAVITGDKTGIAKVTATLTDQSGNQHFDTCDIIVNDPYWTVTPRFLELNASRLQMSNGDTITLNTFIYPKDVLIGPSNKGKPLPTVDQTVLFESSDESIATVNKSGVITATGLPGQRAIITAKTKTSECIAKCTIEIIDNAQNTHIISQNNTNITVGETVDLSTQLEDNSDVQWVSSDPFIVDVDSTGKATAKSRSSALAYDNPDRAKSEKAIRDVTIYATTVNGGIVTKFPMTVTPAEVRPTSVDINKSQINIVKNETAEITAVVAPASILNRKTNDYVSWTSSNENVVTISNDREGIFGEARIMLRGVGEGTATVTATTSNGLTDVCEVTVTDGNVSISSINLESSKQISTDQMYQLQTSITSTATNQRMTWLSTDRTIATVDREGNVMGYKDGTVDIYAIANDSIDEDERKILDMLCDKRTLGNEDIETLRGLSITSETCRLTVSSPSIYLRNLHAPAEAVTSNSVNLLWNRASGNTTSALDHYNIYVNGSYYTQTTKFGQTITGLSPNTSYTFRVEAVVNGNVKHTEQVSISTKVEGKTLNVLDYGAKGDGSTLDTVAIQRAINVAEKGDTVLLPEGYVFTSGALFLKSDMNFQVDGILLGSSDPKDYPLMVTRFECWRKIYDLNWDNSYNNSINDYSHSSLINVGVYDEGDASYTGPYNTKNVIISGKGQINGNGMTLGNNEGGPDNNYTSKPDGSLRGRLISVHNTEGLYLRDLTLGYGASWTNHIIYSKNVTVDNVKIISTAKGSNETLNGDGMDPDSTTYMNVFNSFFLTGDDSITMKSGRGQEGVDLDKPTAYVRVTDCVSGTASIDGFMSKGGFSVGSEVSGGIHDILFQNVVCDGAGASHGLWIKAYCHRGGLVEDITYRDAKVTETTTNKSKYNKNSVYLQTSNSPTVMNQGNANLPAYFSKLRRVTYENLIVDGKVKIGGQQPSEIAGHEGTVVDASYIEDVVFDGIQIVTPPSTGSTEIHDNMLPIVDISFAQDLEFKNMTLFGEMIDISNEDGTGVFYMANSDDILMNEKTSDSNNYLLLMLSGNKEEALVEEKITNDNVKYGIVTLLEEGKPEIQYTFSGASFKKPHGTTLQVFRNDNTEITTNDPNYNKKEILTNGMYFKLTAKDSQGIESSKYYLIGSESDFTIMPWENPDLLEP